MCAPGDSMDLPERAVRSVSIASLSLAMVAHDNNKRVLHSTLMYEGQPYAVLVTSDLKFMALIERLAKEEPTNELWLTLIATAGPVSQHKAGGEA